MARTVEVGTPEHEEGERQMASQLAAIRASTEDRQRLLDRGHNGNALREPQRPSRDAVWIQARRRRVFALASRAQVLTALTAGEGAVARTSLATLLLRPNEPTAAADYGLAL